MDSAINECDSSVNFDINSSSDIFIAIYIEFSSTNSSIDIDIHIDKAIDSFGAMNLGGDRPIEHYYSSADIHIDRTINITITICYL
jgi:hypothetical protein